ncbi:hypothetical protein BRD13_05400 [Halobacteriales archaeon SW_5_70_135]|nr:MAG: hypothetical protein BRD13_05400 [Halobacteriales archaeon SW_5_70_135]
MTPSSDVLADRRRFLAVLGIGAAGGLAGCAGDGGDGGDGGDDGSDGGTTTTATTSTTPPEELPEPSGSFRGARSSEASNLNFVYNQEDGADDLISDTMDSLYTIRPNQSGEGFEVFPLLGNLEQVDASTYDITLRDNLEYSSEYGSVTASDFVYRIQNVYQADFSAEETGVDGGVTNWTAYPDSGTWSSITIEETGDLTFRLTLDDPDPAFPFRPTASALYPAPRAQNDETIPSLEWTGNLGPYDRDSWEQGSRWVATRDDDYYLAAAARGEGGQLENGIDLPRRFEDAPYFDQIDSQVVPEEAARLQALRNGEIDTAAVPPERVAEFREEVGGVYVQEERQPYVTPVMWNMRANGFLPAREREVRQGMMMAIDKETFAANVFRGFALPAYTMQPQWSRWYPDEEAVADFQWGDPNNAFSEDGEMGPPAHRGGALEGRLHLRVRRRDADQHGVRRARTALAHRTGRPADRDDDRRGALPSVERACRHRVQHPDGPRRRLRPAVRRPVPDRRRGAGGLGRRAVQSRAA